MRLLLVYFVKNKLQKKTENGNSWEFKKKQGNSNKKKGNPLKNKGIQEFGIQNE